MVHSSSLAMLNLQSSIDPQDRHHGEAIAQLDRACRELGFFYIHNHSIPNRQIEEMFRAAQQFFALPVAAKTQLTNCDRVNDRFRGLYLGIGEEVLDPDNPIFDLKEAFDFFPKDNYFGRWLQQNKPESWATAIDPTWHSTQDRFCRVAVDFYQACSETCFQVLQALEIALHLPPTFFQTRFGNSNDLRLNYYPSPEIPPSPGQFRFSEHTDYGGITLLLQDVAGLEIRTPAGDWLAAPPLAGAIGVIVGDLMQRWTNDRYHSVWHRVVMPATFSTPPPRYSLSFFCEPNPDVEVACLENCQPPVAKYKPVLTEAYLIGRVNQAVV